MIFDAIQCPGPGFRRGYVFTRVLGPLAIDIDVQSVLDDIVCVFTFTSSIVIVTNDRLPPVIVVIFKLNHEADHSNPIAIESYSDLKGSR